MPFGRGRPAADWPGGRATTYARQNAHGRLLQAAARRAGPLHRRHDRDPAARPGPGAPWWSSGHRLGWLVALVATIAAIVFFQRGYGDVTSDAVVHGVALVAVWVVLIALVVGGVLHALAGDRATAALPWKAGIYVFPTTVVDARTNVLAIYDTGDDLERIEGSGKSVQLVFKGRTFSFDSDDASAARAAIEQARNEGPTSNEKVRASRDPLSEPRISKPARTDRVPRAHRAVVDAPPLRRRRRGGAGPRSRHLLRAERDGRSARSRT